MNTAPVKKSIWVSAVCAIVVFLILLFLGISDSVLVLRMSSTSDHSGQVFLNTGQGYTPEHSKSFTVVNDGEQHVYNIRLWLGFVKSIRIDPGTSTGKIDISQIELKNYFFKKTINLDNINILHDLKCIDIKSSDLVLNSVGGDPYFDFYLIALNQGVEAVDWLHLALLVLFSVTAHLASKLFIFRKQLLLVKNNPRCEAYFYLALALGFIAFLIFNLHLSSLSEWSGYVGSQMDSGILFGESRAIRSDEWLVQTPYYASQVANNFSLYNPSIGPEKSTLVSGVPVASIYGYAQPRFWGFYLAGFDHGLSWLYAFRLFGLLLSSFLVFKLITKNDFWFSIVGALWICFSSFTQWWFGSNLPDMMIGAFLSIFSLHSIWFSNSKAKQIFWMVILFFSAFTFITALYPPFQIPLGYLSIFITLGLFVRDRFTEHFSYFKLGCIAIAVLLGGAIILSWLDQSSEIIKLVLNSVYPGKRIVTGGDLKSYQFISGYLGPFLSETKFPRILGNVCEASNFFYVFVMLFLILFYGNRRDIITNPLNIFLFGYVVVICTWLFFGFASEVAITSRMSMSPPNRALIGLGLANIFLSISVFCNASANEKHKHSIGSLLLFSVVALSITFFTYAQFDDFVNFPRLLGIFALLNMLGYSLIYHDKFIFLLSIFLVILNGFFVNPIAKGAAVMHSANLAAIFHKLEPNNSRRWIVFSDFVLPQYLKAQGERVINGAKYMPDLDDMKILDPEGIYKNIWYRYSNLLVINDPKLSFPEFELKQTDVVILKLNVCSKEVRKLGITNVAFTSAQNVSENKCIHSIHQGPVNGMWLYSIKKTGGRID